MLQRLIVRRFKSLAKADIVLGGLNLLIGTNASGKSNLLDALRVLQGVGYGFTVSEIFDGRPKGATSVAWEGIRGGSSEALFQPLENKQGKQSRAVYEDCSFSLTLTLDGRSFRYVIRLEPATGRVYQERLLLDGRDVYASTDAGVSTPVLYARVYTGRPGRPAARPYERHRPLLHQLRQDSNISEDIQDMLQDFSTALSNQQPLYLEPTVLRQYSQARRANRMGEHGENFAALVQGLLGKASTRAAYEGWLRELTPREIDSVVIKKGALSEPLFAVREGEREFPAPVLSDGTLRFAALTAALLQPDLPGLLLLEEIENGIHPTRLRLLVELLDNRTTSGELQVLATTHSPLLLAWLKPDHYATTFHCARDASGRSVIQSLTQLPDFQRVVRRQPLGDLFAEGWFESLL